MSDLNYISSVLNATILSTKSSVTLEQCNRDYKELEGEWIPYKRLGFKSLEQFFENLPGFKLVRLSNGSHTVEARKSNETKHITDMVQRQKSSKSKGSRHQIQRPVRNLRSDSFWKPNNSYGYSKAPIKVSSVYKRPKVNPSSISNKFSQPVISNRDKSNKIPPPVTSKTQITNHTKTSDKIPNLIQPSRPIVKTPLPNPVINKASTVESENIVTSKLSGIKPGDILARSQINSSNNLNVMKDNKLPMANQAVMNNKVSAANRLTALQNTLQTVEPEVTNIKVKSDVVKPVAEVVKYEPLMRQDSLDAMLKTLNDNKSRLIKCCEVMNLPQPVFKTVQIKQKRGNLYDCTVKIDSKYSFSTYPNSQTTETQAIEAAALAGVVQLKKAISEESHSVSDPVTAISRIIEIVSGHPCGLWANTLPNMYKEEHKELLPKNWIILIDQCPHITKEIGMNDMVMLLPNSKIPSKSPQPITNDTSKLAVGPPTLQFPDESLWSVYVMSVYSTVEIWLRIVGMEYSDAYETLLTDMEMYFMEDENPSREIVEGGWYGLNADDSWLRVRILEIDSVNKQALCFLVDNGDEETYSFEDLHDLPSQFLSLPPQAILCRLAGLEEYALVGNIDNERNFLSDALSGKVLVAEILQTPDEKQDDPSITVVLFDTSTDVDVNINKELLRQFSERASSPQLPHGVSEIYVMDVTTSGVLCAQIHDDSWKLLQNMLHQIASGPFPIESLQASFGDIVPSPRVNYLVKSLCGEWRRGVLRSGVTVDESGVKCVAVRYIDCGRTESVPVKNLVLLERISDALNCFPAQVLYLTLHNVGTLNSDQMEKINNLVPRNSPVLCKQIAKGSNIVDLFVRIKPHDMLCSVSNALMLEKELTEKLNCEEISSVDPLKALNKKKERLFALKKLSSQFSKVSIKRDQVLNIVPEKGTYFDVVVCMASNPRNFVVQPLQHLEELMNLMTNLQSVCENLSKQVITFSKNKMYAVYHQPSQQWYRASFLGMAFKDSPSMYFIDYGDYYTAPLDSLRELPSEFLILPPMAMKAKLYGVKPTDQDWSVEDCVRFIELVNEQSFASVVKDIEEDPMNDRETILVLDLVDTSTHEDLYVNALLVKEKRAIPI